jgi:hypothetical protein
VLVQQSVVARSGTRFSCGLLWRSRLGVSPTGGCTQHVFGLARPDPRGVGRLAPGFSIRGRSRCSFVPDFPATQSGWLIPPKWASRWWRLGRRGRRRSLVPGGGRGGGVCGRGTSVSQLDRVAGTAGHHSWDRSIDREPVSPPPSTPATGSHLRRSHRFISSEGVFCLSAHFKGKIGVPSKRLAARDSTSNAHPGLAVHLWPCVVTEVDACGSRSAPARRSPQLLLAQCRTKRSTSNTFFECNRWYTTRPSLCA